MDTEKVIQALIDQDEAVRFLEQGLDPVPSSSAEKGEHTGRGIPS